MNVAVVCLIGFMPRSGILSAPVIGFLHVSRYKHIKLKRDRNYILLARAKVCE